MRYPALLIATLFASATPCARAAASDGPGEGLQVKVTTIYDQSPGLWNTYNQVKNAQQDISAINSILSHEYGTYEEGNAIVRVEANGIPLARDTPMLRSIYFGLASEVTAFGLVDNPVVPVLHANLIAVGELAAGVDGEIKDWGLTTRIGAIAGSGYEKSVNAESTDLIEHFPFQGGHLSFYGFDEKAAKTIAITSWSSAISLSLDLHETFFYSTIPPNDIGLYSQPSNLFTFRWKERNSFDRRVSLPTFERARLGLELIAGQQPVPVEMLPRLWDYTHQLDAFPELGTLVGAGLRFKGYWSKAYALEASLGIYAGYLGGGLSFHLSQVTLTAGNWELEGRSAYQSLGSRLWSFSAAAAF